MEASPVNPGTLYKFRVKDHMEDGWFRMFSGLQVKNIEDGEVLISGCFTTQAAVHEILNRIRDLNLILISVESIHLPDPQKS